MGPYRTVTWSGPGPRPLFGDACCKQSRLGTQFLHNETDKINRKWHIVLYLVAPWRFLFHIHSPYFVPCTAFFIFYGPTSLARLYKTNVYMILMIKCYGTERGDPSAGHRKAETG